MPARAGRVRRTRNRALPVNLFRRSHRLSEFATAPLLGMVLALILTVIPLAEKVANWVLAGFLAVCATRMILNRPGARLPGLPIKLLLFAGGVGGVIFTYGTALGVEPGFSILVVLVSLKLIESNGPRDFHVLALLGFFLALCDLFSSQDLLRWLYVAAVLLLLLATLVRFHRGEEGASYPRATAQAATLLFQALPVAALLFLFFPRVYGGFRFQFSQSLMNIGAMSDHLSPGSISSIALSDQIVFRADFPSSTMPSISTMYWRGGVLWHIEEPPNALAAGKKASSTGFGESQTATGDGLNWVQGPELSRERRSRQFSGPAVVQRISLQPHGAHWLFALDHPASPVHGAYYIQGNVLKNIRAVTSRLRYEVISRPEDHETTLPVDQRTEALRLPSHIAPRVQALVDGWKAENADPQAIVNAAGHYFRHEHFIYTISPGEYRGNHALEEFLFERRQGFCEHYAAAFATLMRIAGIPSRIVIGYHGGEFNTLGKYVIVRQADAHAWCEVWLKRVGWVRVDPTDMIAPDRISSSLASYLESKAEQNDPSTQRSLTATGWREIQHELQLAWDSVNYQWDLRVLNFDEEAQHNFLFAVGLGAFTMTEILVWVVVILAFFLAALGFWLRRSRQALDKVSRGYARFCGALARAGLAREAWEGPQSFAARAAERFPAQAAVIEQIAALYIELRYGTGAPNPQPFLAAVRRLPRFTATKHGMN